MKLLKIGLIFIMGILVLAITFVGFLTVFEYRPQPIEEVEIIDNQTRLVSLNETISFMTFNIGYAGLGANEDFVMDGGKKGRADSKDIVEGYLAGIIETLETYPSDFYLLQEVDLKARRSYNINQVEQIHEAIGTLYSSQFSYNFKVPFVPFPLSFTDHIGYVESGLTTYQKVQAETSQRYQFPGSFSWPLRVANLKRAMMITSIPIENSSKSLFVINLHMSAYDGDGSLRTQEMALLKEVMTSLYEAGHYVVVGGDFNQTFPAAKDIYPVSQDLYIAYPMEDDWLPDGFSFEIDLDHPTCRLLNQPYDPSDPKTQYYIIDGFIVSDNIDIVTSAQTLNLGFEHSDHNPVILSLRLNP